MHPRFEIAPAFVDQPLTFNNPEQPYVNSSTNNNTSLSEIHFHLVMFLLFSISQTIRIIGLSSIIDNQIQIN